MNKFQIKQHYISSREDIQKKLKNRIAISMTFHNDINWCEFEAPKTLRKKLSESQKETMIIIK